MTNYTPFLKLKANEVGAFSSLTPGLQEALVPFFDLPRKKEMTGSSFSEMVAKSAKKLTRHLGKDKQFYLDNFDIDDALLVDGADNYEFVINEFSDLNFIPVVGLDRSRGHNAAVFDAKGDGRIRSNSVAIRLLEDEFQDFALIESDLQDLLDECSIFERAVLILDCRLCLNVNPAAHAIMIGDFIKNAVGAFDYNEIIITGSSVPASIADVVKVETKVSIGRVELAIHRALRVYLATDTLGVGDYTIVSPLYSDLALPDEMMPNVTAPKVLYSYDDTHYVARGGALKTHARGNYQYNDLAADIVMQPFFRGAAYSYGDYFIDDKSKNIGAKKVTPGSVLKPTINAHITYMAIGHALTI